jgi:hypothetical protein
VCFNSLHQAFFEFTAPGLFFYSLHQALFLYFFSPNSLQQAMEIEDREAASQPKKPPGDPSSWITPGLSVKFIFSSFNFV